MHCSAIIKTLSRNRRRKTMDAHIRKVYVPMTETGFYILLCLREECHGYGIVQRVEALTDGEIRLSPGTMYGSLSKMEKDGLICFVREEEKRKIYRITELGSQVLALEMKRIERLYRNMMEVRGHEGS
jgi:DNA-binding PadR family transcriptional regulator